MSLNLKDYKVLVCVGSGGVGKTTLSSGIGVLAARSGLKVLVLTIDPSQRLATALGLQTGFEGEVKVSDESFSGELYAALIDPKKVFESFIYKTSENKETAERLIKNRLYKQMSTVLSGSQEFTSLERLYAAVESNNYDIVILDTPPAKHAMDFLNAPEKIYKLFQSSMTQWFISSGQKKGLFKKIFNKSTKLVFSVLERLTGADFLIEISDFFQSIHGIQEVIADRSKKVHHLLTKKDTGFLLITGYDEEPLEEAEYIYENLMAEGYGLNGIIVNRSFPEWTQKEVLSDEQLLSSEAYVKLIHWYKKMNKNFMEREVFYQKFYDTFKKKDVSVFRMPDIHQEIVGLESLDKISTLLKKFIK